MSEIDELRAKAMASMPPASSSSPSLAAIPNPNLDPRPPPPPLPPPPPPPPFLNKEEGEISSSSEGDLLACSGAPSSNTTLTEPSYVNSRSKPCENSVRGSVAAANRLSRSSVPRQNRIPVKQNYSKQINQLPFKSHPRTWHASSGSSDNLVISFSDDDTESEQEESTPEAKAKSLKRSRTTTSNLRTQLSQRVLNSKSKMMQSRPPVIHSSIPSVTKMVGSNSRGPRAATPENSLRVPSVVKTSGANSRGSGAASLENRQLPHGPSVMKTQGANSRGAGAASPETQVANSKGAASSESRLRLLQYGPTIKSVGVQRQEGGKNVLADNKAEYMCQEIEENRSKSQEHTNQKKRKISILNKCISSPSVMKTLVVSSTEAAFPENTLRPLQYDPTINSTAVQIQKQQGGKNALSDNEVEYLHQEIEENRFESQEHTDQKKRKISSLKECSSEHPDTNGVAEATRQNRLISSGNPGSTTDDLEVKRSKFDENSQNKHIRGEQSKLPISYAEHNSIVVTNQRMITLDEKLESQMGASHKNKSSMSNHSKCDVMDIESLMKLEEMKDKELEEAQVLRRSCELEERQALKAYRKAQRALINANERCSLLYRQRELFSAQLRASIMEISNSLWAPNWQSKVTALTDSIERFPRASNEHLPSQDHQVLDKCKTMDVLGHESNLKCGDSTSSAECRDDFFPNSSSQHLLGLTLGSEKFIELDGGASDPKDNSTMNGAYATNSSADEEKENVFASGSADSHMICESGGEKMVAVDVESERMLTSKVQDYELEAMLRSKLHARFGKKSDNMNNDEIGTVAGANVEVDAIPVGQMEAGKYHEGQLPFSSKQLLEEEKNSMSDNDCRRADFGGGTCFQEELCRPQSCHGTIHSLPSSVVEVVSRNVKFVVPELTISHEKDFDINCNVCLGAAKGGFAEHDARMPRMIAIDSYTCDLAIDPFWPICMFDLRGKCNDDECAWQHIRDCTQRHQKQIDGPDCLTTLGNFIDAHKPSQVFHGKTVLIPAYRIGSNLIKAEKQPSRSLLARNNWIYWQIWFCTSFCLPFSIQRLLPSDAPLLYKGGHSDDDDNLKRLPLCSQSQDGSMNHIMRGFSDPELSLELAIDLFNDKANKLLGRKEALSLLSRSLESNPKSPVVWIVYLYMYYRKEKDLGEDDMFLHAVQHNEVSYELWLMYINSRMQLDTRMNAYNEALSILCHRGKIYNMDNRYLSACILDIFLQMMDFLSMSGNVETAISRIYELLDHPKDSETSKITLLFDILSCLVVPDRCIFWICCIYFALYRKLPGEFVQQFESEKDMPFEIEWPFIQLATSEKHQALELMRVALDTIDLDTMEEISFENDCFQKTALRSAHFMAVSHVRFIVAVEGLNCATYLLDTYLNKYPTCIELIKLSAHCCKILKNDLGFETFEKALRDWPEKSPGFQCLWNQCVGYALNCKKIYMAKSLITCWFSCFCKIHDPEVRKSGDDNLSGLVELPYLLLEDADSSQEDMTFGLLNLFLYEVLQKDMDKACMVIDKVLKEASPDYFKHCAREHASFFISSGLASFHGGPDSRALALLCGYLGDIRYSPMLQPLSRRFCQTIKKPRVRQLIDSLLGPVSLDCSLLNSILEGCYGPELLPEKFQEPKDLVDLVESLIEISPANYKLALRAYKLAARSFKGTGAMSTGIMFWASSLLVNTVIQSFPVAPEQVWLEVATLLNDLEIHAISERFHQQAVLVYPFSIKLWQSNCNLSKMIGNTSSVVESARERGIRLVG